MATQTTKLSKIHKELLGLMSAGYSLACYGEPERTVSVYMRNHNSKIVKPVACLDRNTLAMLLSNGFIEVDELNSHKDTSRETRLMLTDKGNQAIA